MFINRVFIYLTVTNTVDMASVVADIYLSFALEDPPAGGQLRGAFLSRRTVASLANGILYRPVSTTFTVRASVDNSLVD
jgi:hypothetical protein